MFTKPGIKGLKEIRDSLRDLGGKEAGAAVATSITKFGKKIRDSLSWNAPKVSGALSESQDLQTKKKAKTGEIVTWIGANAKYVLKNATYKRQVMTSMGLRTRTVTADKKPVQYALKVERESPKHKGWMLAVFNKNTDAFFEDFKKTIWNRIEFYSRKKATTGG